jgi:hypothetical protein
MSDLRCFRCQQPIYACDCPPCCQRCGRELETSSILAESTICVRCRFGDEMFE